MPSGTRGISIKEFKDRYGSNWREAVAAMGSPAQRKKYGKTKKNPPKLKTGVWIKADKVRVVQRNGRKVVEVKRFVKSPKRKHATAKRRR